jgi:ABC-type polar amino acid transport system ATPase subunit
MEGWKPQDNGKVPSILSAFDNRRNSKNVYANNLMEKILAKDNMNQAYRQVVRNKGKHGIDGMTIDELLPYLKEIGYHMVNGKRNRQPEKVITSQHILTEIVFQPFDLFPHMSVIKNIMFGLVKVKHMSKTEAEELATKWLERVGLGQKLHSYPSFFRVESSNVAE